MKATSGEMLFRLAAKAEAPTIRSASNLSLRTLGASVIIGYAH